MVPGGVVLGLLFFLFIIYKNIPLNMLVHLKPHFTIAFSKFDISSVIGTCYYDLQTINDKYMKQSLCLHSLFSTYVVWYPESIITLQNKTKLFLLKIHS